MFNLDSSEVLTVEAKDVRTGREVKEVLAYKGGTKMTSDEIARRRSEIAGAFGGSGSPPVGGQEETGNTVSPPNAGSGIPDEFKGYYKKARALADSLPPNRAAPLNEACASLMRSVETGESGAIKQAGEKLQLAYWDAQV